MGFWELFLIAVGLSMDAFAAAVCKGLSMRRIRWGQAAAIAFSFGFFQAIMPLIGWMLGRQFERYIVSFDHWIAFVLLAFIGGKMIYEALSDKEDAPDTEYVRLDLKELFLLSLATSIDALMVGVTFAFLSVRIIPAVTLIGMTTAFLSAAGVLIGFRFGSRYQSRAELAGGCILVLIGLKILLEHLGLFAL